jgi:hypothetical protein
MWHAGTRIRLTIGEKKGMHNDRYSDVFRRTGIRDFP